MSDEPRPIAKEPIVLDAEGHVLHNPNVNRESETRVYQFSGTGILPKIFIGALLGGLLLLGLTVAGIVLGILFLGFRLTRR